MVFADSICLDTAMDKTSLAADIFIVSHLPPLVG